MFHKEMTNLWHPDAVLHYWYTIIITLTDFKRLNIVRFSGIATDARVFYSLRQWMEWLVYFLPITHYTSFLPCYFLFNKVHYAIFLCIGNGKVIGFAPHGVVPCSTVIWNQIIFGGMWMYICIAAILWIRERNSFRQATVFIWIPQNPCFVRSFLFTEEGPGKAVKHYLSNICNVLVKQFFVPFGHVAKHCWSDMVCLPIGKNIFEIS